MITIFTKWNDDDNKEVNTFEVETIPDYPADDADQSTYDNPFYACQSGMLSGNDKKYGEA